MALLIVNMLCYQEVKQNIPNVVKLILFTMMDITYYNVNNIVCI